MSLPHDNALARRVQLNLNLANGLLLLRPPDLYQCHLYTNIFHSFPAFISFICPLLMNRCTTFFLLSFTLLFLSLHSISSLSLFFLQYVRHPFDPFVRFSLLEQDLLSLSLFASLSLHRPSDRERDSLLWNDFLAVCLLSLLLFP